MSCTHQRPLDLKEDVSSLTLDRFGNVFLWDSGSSVGNVTGHSKAINAVDYKPTRPFRICTASEDSDVGFFEGPPFKFHHFNKVSCPNIIYSQISQDCKKKEIFMRWSSICTLHGSKYMYTLPMSKQTCITAFYILINFDFQAI